MEVHKNISSKSVTDLLKTREWNSSVQSSELTDKQTNSMVWVRERSIPTERRPLVGEAIANLCG
jgi:hypothetical protein